MLSRFRAPVVLLLLLSAVVAQSAAAQNAGTVVGTVTDARSRSAIAGVVIRVVGRQQNAVTRANGGFRLQLQPGDYELQAVSIGFAPLKHSVVVNPGGKTSQDFVLTESAQPIDEVVTIGTRRLDRTVTQSPVPIDVISEALLQSTGLAETWQMLQRTVPSLNFPHYPLTDDNMRSITLRGLAPDQVLVLVNGKRRHTAAIVETSGPLLNGSVPVDINAIPTSAIERIEVLRDGAAAQYGSDAIAGVVNIVLKSGESRSARTTFGQTTSSEGGRSFRDGDLFDLSSTYGVMSANGAQATLTAQLRNRQRTNRAYPDSGQQYFIGDARNSNPPIISSHEGNASARDIAIMLNASAPFAANAEAYVFGGIANRQGSGSGFFRRANAPTTVRSIHPDGFLPEIGSDVRDASIFAGARGTTSGWRWDVSSGLGSNSVRSSVHNSNNVTLGNASPTDFYTGLQEFSQWTSNLDLSRQLNIALPDPLNFALGAEFRLDRYRIGAGDPDSYRDGGVTILDGPSAGQLGAVGAQGVVGFRPIDEVRASRNNIAAYADIDSRVIRSLLLDLAGRIERYSDFGSTSTGKAAARFEPLRGFAIRGAMATGFRAPSLTQSYYSTTTNTLLADHTTGTLRTLPVNTPEAQVLGATPLRAEKSVNLSGGIVVDIPRWPTITADYYAIRVNDRIVLSGIFNDPSVAVLLAEHGLRGVDGGRYFTNAIDTRTRGVDIVANYAVSFQSAGLLRLTGGYNQTKTRVTRVSLTPPELSAFQSTLFGRVWRGKVELGPPDRTMLVAANYSVSRFAFNLNTQRFGRATLLDATNPDLDQTVSPKWITDLAVSYELQRRLEVGVTVNNLFDVYPDQWRDFDRGKDGVLSLSGVFRYPGALSPFGMDGRTVYVHMSYR